MGTVYESSEWKKVICNKKCPDYVPSLVKNDDQSVILACLQVILADSNAASYHPHKCLWLGSNWSFHFGPYQTVLTIWLKTGNRLNWSALP